MNIDQINNYNIFLKFIYKIIYINVKIRFFNYNNTTSIIWIYN